MSRAHRLAAAATVAAVCALPATAPAAKKVTCTKRSGDTLLRDSTLRVYQNVKHAKGDPDASTVTVSFCTPGSKAKSKRLTTFDNTLDGAITIDAALRAGPDHVALDVAESTGTVDAEGLYLHRLSTRVRTFEYSSEDPFTFAVTTGGGVALLQGGVVKVFDGAGERQVATGADRLAASGETVYWTAAGAAASTVLSGEGKRTTGP